MQTLVELSDDQADALAAFCREVGISQVDAIRQAVDELFSSQRVVGVQENFEAGFGLWRNRMTDSRGYISALRAEWDE